jgi:primase-polymerase (primpol)-like protein
MPQMKKAAGFAHTAAALELLIVNNENIMGDNPNAIQPGNTSTDDGVIVAPAAVRAALWANIPRELRERRQWCITPGTDTDKAPRTVTGTKASSTDPSTWTNFDTAACAAYQASWHIGYVFAADDPYACIDFDVCDEDTQRAKGQAEDPSKWTTNEEMATFWEAVQRLDSYAELSRSGKGLHVIVKGDVGTGMKRPPIEIYSQARFMIFTGDIRFNRPIQDQQAWLDDQVRERTATPAVPLVEVAATESDEAVYWHARSLEGKQHPGKFDALWRGEWRELGYPSQSEADEALMSYLIHASPSNEQVRRLFRYSGLGQRPKARRDSYLNYTLRRFRAQQAWVAQMQAGLVL